MSKQERYRVLSLMQEWAVRRESDGRIMSSHPSEEAAEAAALALARRDNGRVVNQRHGDKAHAEGA